MKINKILYKIIITTFLIIMCTSCICMATGNGLPNLNDEGYKPVANLDGTPKTIVSKILGALQAIGGILIVISIALIGFNTIMASANDKAVAQEKYIGLLVAALVITFGSTLARAIASVAEGL